MHGDDSYKPEEISSFILRKLVEDAEQKLGEEIKNVVITCPAYFGINEREATRRAGEIAGLNVRQVLNEPTAAAIAFDIVETEQDKVILVYDLGGGTFDITMIEIKPDTIKVICTDGEKTLGGRDWDDEIVNYAALRYVEETGSSEDILEDSETWQDLQIRAEDAKKTLSQREKTAFAVSHGGERVKVEITREKFEELTKSRIERTISLTHDMLEEARKKGYESFDEILLVGGSVKMPQVAERVKEEFSTEPKIFDPDEAVAKGAALFAHKTAVSDEFVKRLAEETGMTPEEIEEADPEEIPKEAMAAATEKTADVFSLPASDIEKSQRKIENVVSKSFGVVSFISDDSDEQAVVNLILKNTTVPADITQEFGTREENQQKVELRIMENEASDPTIDPELAIEIGNAVLDLPPGLPAHSPIDITFRLNEEGRLEMTATERTESRRIDMTIETTSVIQGEELEEAKARSLGMVVS
jgi:molecular chaperone DnaK (HSP70)